MCTFINSHIIWICRFAFRYHLTERSKRRQRSRNYFVEFWWRLHMCICRVKTCEWHALIGQTTRYSSYVGVSPRHAEFACFLHVTTYGYHMKVHFIGSIFQFFFTSSLAWPVIWGRRYSWLASSSILPCLLHCPLSTPPLSYLSYIHICIICLAALFFFSLVSPHLAFFSRCAPLSFSTHGLPLQLFFCNFNVSCCPSDVFISDVIPPCHSAHTYMHPYLIYLSRAYCLFVVAQISVPDNITGLTTLV